MDCPDCASPVVSFAVPTAFLDAVPGEEETVGLCTQCLALHPTDTADADPAFHRISNVFPDNEDGAAPLAILVGLLDSLALYRSEITELLEAVEQSGTDPLLVLDRLAADPTIETETDLRGRRKQLAQLL